MQRLYVLLGLPLGLPKNANRTGLLLEWGDTDKTISE